MHVTRERLDAATVVVRSPDAVSAPVSKVGLDPDGRARIDREASIGLAVAATLVDLATPRQVPGPPWALALSPVTGEPASNVLRRTPSRAAQVVRPLIDAFGAWHRRTASDGNGTDWITRLVRPPVDRLRPAVPSLARYLAHVVELAEAAGPVRLVATHGDLTMSNVLVGTDTLGVVDWEAAESSGMPLADLWYAVADATVCARGLDRATAVSELAGGRDTWGAVSQIDAVADALGMSADARELAFQLTWVMHAANEVDRDGTGGEFLAVLHTVAARRA
jgi:hypothetical protein